MGLLVTMYLLHVTFITIFLATGWIIPVYDVRSQERFGFAEDFLRLVLLEQSNEGGGALLVYALAPLDKEGYIINEEGQLVPFKIYKKGGARLHPRNCRGGFHKRLINGPGEQQQPTDNIYDLRVVKRNTRNNPNKKERETPTPIFGNDHANVFNPGFDQADAGTEMTSYVQEELKLLKEYNDKFLSEYPEQILVEVDPEQLEQNSDNDKTISLPFKQSRNSNDINDEFVPKNGLHVRDSDYRYVKSWPSYSSDSSLSIDYPKQVAHREPYSYLPDNVDDLSRTGSRTYIAGYDVTEYLPFKQRRQR